MRAIHCLTKNINFVALSEDGQTHRAKSTQALAHDQKYVTLYPKFSFSIGYKRTVNMVEFRNLN